MPLGPTPPKGSSSTVMNIIVSFTQALPQLTSDEHDNNGGKDSHQQRVIACEFDQLIDIHW